MVGGRLVLRLQAITRLRIQNNETRLLGGFFK